MFVNWGDNFEFFLTLEETVVSFFVGEFWEPLEVGPDGDSNFSVSECFVEELGGDEVEAHLWGEELAVEEVHEPAVSGAVDGLVEVLFEGVVPDLVGDVQEFVDV